MIRKQFLLFQRFYLPAFVALALASFSASASTYSVLYTFGPFPDGHNPNPGLVIDSAGNIYGTTLEGGTSNACGTGVGCGTLFKLSPNSDGTYTETILFNFLGDSTTGAFPGGLIFDSAGNLYGTTGTGGPCDNSGCGTVFEFTPNSDGSWTHNTLFDFPGESDGTFPTYGLTFDSAGNIYGTTGEGGTENCGTIYELSPAGGGSWTHTVLYNFQCGSNGINPNGGLLMDSRGNLYGTVLSGGSSSCSLPSCGFVFELVHGSGGQWTPKSLYNFSGGTDGGEPETGLAFSNGSLYGTTYFGGDLGCGGSSGCGVLFQLTEGSGGIWMETVIHSFTDGVDGAYPLAAPVFDSTGNLYGASQGSGSNNYGDVFKRTRLPGGGWSMNSLHHFGSAPLGAGPNSINLDVNGNVFGTAAYGGLIPCGVNSGNGCGTVFEITP